MSEATHKAALCKILRAGLPVGEGRVFRHEDMFSAGIPDISISYRGKTAWVEVKLDRPGRKSRVTPLQAKALHELDGYLLTFVEGKGGEFSAVLVGRGKWFAQVGGKVKAKVYRALAEQLLREVGAWMN